MIDRLFLYNFPIKSNAYQHDDGLINYHNSFGNCFKLKTCQRLLILSYDSLNLESLGIKNKKSAPPLILSGANAYQYVLEVLCGLQSQMLGEQEIVGQFKEAFRVFSSSEKRHRNISIILEKLLKDAKEIRTSFLSHIGQSSYAAVAKKIISKSSHNEILIIGTGHLALDLLQYFRKTHSIVLCARNKSKIEEWQQIAPFKVIPWINPQDLLNYPIIMNTVGVPNYKLLNQDFFYQWKKNHPELAYFLDFGSPSSVEIPPQFNNAYTLSDLFSHGNEVDLQKLAKIEQAKRAVEQVSLKRILWLDQKVQRDLSYSPSASFNF